MMRALLLLLIPGLAHALPQFAVRAGADCASCHQDPGLLAAAEASEARCTLDCGACHVAPTGGGMRSASGRYFARHALPMGRLLSHPAADQIEPLVRLWSAPEDALTPRLSPGGRARLGGLDGSPDVQLGASLRLGALLDADTEPHGRIVPQQADLQLAVRPYNPRRVNAGRLTLLADVGLRQDPAAALPELTSQAFAREWYALLDDLPYRAYARVGRFLPAHGWRLADATAFTRRAQTVFGRPFDFEGQVTGVELGLNPGPLYLHASAFNAAERADRPLDLDAGFGGAVALGWRRPGWQIGASAIGGRQRAAPEAERKGQLAFSLQWALNLGAWLPALPLIYLGELQANHDLAGQGAALSAFHEASWRFFQGLEARLGYTWSDPSTHFAYDTAHRAHLELAWYPAEFFELIVQARHGWRHTDERFGLDGDALLFQLHAHY